MRSRHSIDEPRAVPPDTLAARSDHASRVHPALAGSVRALDGVTVGFPTGSLTAIMGPSGAGKSTHPGLHDDHREAVADDVVDLADATSPHVFSADPSPPGPGDQAGRTRRHQQHDTGVGRRAPASAHQVPPSAAGTAPGHPLPW